MNQIDMFRHRKIRLNHVFSPLAVPALMQSTSGPFYRATAYTSLASATIVEVRGDRTIALLDGDDGSELTGSVLMLKGDDFEVYDEDY